MPPACRVGDNANCPNDSHGNDCCSHNVTGPAVAGAPNVSINGQKVLRVGDPGVHSACCGPNTWVTAQGSATVFINGIPVVRQGDKTTHCGGTGKMIEGSPNVHIGLFKSRFLNSQPCKLLILPTPFPHRLQALS